MSYPNLVLIGAAKAGTTSVFNWLERHPEVCVSSAKETYHFFVRDEEQNGIKKFEKQDFESYQRYFKNCQDSQVICEATPEYLYSESAIGAFKQLNNNCYFLFIRRDPAERIYSEYTFHKYKTKRFKGNFEAYIGYKEGKFTGKKVKYGFYQRYLEKWIEAFGKDKVIEMEFTLLKNNPVDFMKSLAEKIGIDPTPFAALNLTQKNKSVKIKHRKLHLALIELANKIPQPIVDRISPLYYKLNSSNIPKITEKEKRLVEELKGFYSNI